MEFVPARACILSKQGIVIFVPGMKVEEKGAIETADIYGRTISRTANLYSKRRQSNNKRKWRERLDLIQTIINI